MCRIIKIILVLLFSQLSAPVLAWDSYNTDDYNTGYSQSWQQYKVDNQIETPTQPTFWQNVGNWFSTAFEYVSTTVSNFVDTIKNYFSPQEQNIDIKTLDIEQSQINTQDIEISLSEQSEPQLDITTEQIEKDMLDKTETKDKSISIDETEVIQEQEYSSVAAGAYKTNIEIDEYALLPDGAKEADISISQLPEHTIEIRNEIGNAVSRIQNNENMIMVVLQTMQNIQNVTLTGEQIRLVAVEQDKMLLNNVHLNLLNNVDMLTKAEQNIAINLNTPIEQKITNTPFTLNIASNVNIMAKQTNNTNEFDIAPKGIRLTSMSGKIFFDVRKIEIRDNQSIVVKFKIMGLIPKQKVFNLKEHK